MSIEKKQIMSIICLDFRNRTRNASQSHSPQSQLFEPLFRLAIFQSNNFPLSTLTQTQRERETRDERDEGTTNTKEEKKRCLAFLLSSGESPMSGVELKAKWKKPDQLDEDDDNFFFFFFFSSSHRPIAFLNRFQTSLTDDQRWCNQIKNTSFSKRHRFFLLCSNERLFNQVISDL